MEFRVNKNNRVGADSKGWSRRTASLAVSALILLAVSGTAFGQLQVCGAQAGGSTPETHAYAISSSTGEFEVSWQMFTIPDQMIVTVGGQTLFDTGCAQGSGTETLSLPGGATSATVQIEMRPGRFDGGALACDEGAPGTAWNFEVRAENCESVPVPPEFTAIPVPTTNTFGVFFLILMMLGLASVTLRMRLS